MSLPAAFKLVRNILTEQPGLTTREIVNAAIAIHQQEGGSASSSSSSISAETISVSAGKKKAAASSGSGTTKARGVNVVPEGHPFVSTSYLKHRVLPILASHDLITKSTRPSSSSSSSTSGKPTFTWSLHTPRQTNLSTEQWSFPTHWDRLLSGDSPGLLHHEYTQNLQDRKEEERQRAFDSGKIRRSEREMWEWQGRKEGLTTNLERVNLNTRRRNARPKKERSRLEKYEQLLAGLPEPQGQGQREEGISM